MGFPCFLPLVLPAVQQRVVIGQADFQRRPLPPLFLTRTTEGSELTRTSSTEGSKQMIGIGTSALKIFVALEAQDLRKSFQGLTELALQHLSDNLSREALFVFTSRTRTRIKLLFDGIGLWVATKRLEEESSAGRLPVSLIRRRSI